MKDQTWFLKEIVKLGFESYSSNHSCKYKLNNYHVEVQLYSRYTTVYFFHHKAKISERFSDYELAYKHIESTINKNNGI